MAVNIHDYLVPISDTRLFVSERGSQNNYPLIVLHGGPGLDHHTFGDYLDALTDHYRLILVDQRAQGQSEPASENTWTLSQMANDVNHLAIALSLKSYAVLGHSYGSFVDCSMPRNSLEKRHKPSSRAVSHRRDSSITSGSS